jgi:hypothetical protein
MPSWHFAPHSQDQWELINLRCQLIDHGGPRRPESFSHLSDDAVAFHRSELKADGAWGQAEFGGDIVRSTSPRAQEPDDSSTARVEQLLSQHFPYLGSVEMTAQRNYEERI